MLQQTTVAAVVPYFERFLARFSDVGQLAAAAEEDVLRFWEGLGYYSRARNLHRAAQSIVGELRGEFPQTVAELERLPGIGRYTAGAIVSFAFDRAAPIVEANTLRLYCRLLGFPGDPRSVDGQSTLWAFAESIVPAKSPGRFNQALIELGATVCTPVSPNCEKCPVNRWCSAFARGAQGDIPRLAKRPALTEVTEIAVAVERDGRFLLFKLPEGERWAGLWDFVRFSLDESLEPQTPKQRPVFGRASARNAPNDTQFTDAAQIRRVAEAAGIDIDAGTLIAEIRHGVTRYRITLRCYRAQWTSGEPIAAGREFRWVSAQELRNLPLSTTGRRLARLIEETP